MKANNVVNVTTVITPMTSAFLASDGSKSFVVRCESNKTHILMYSERSHKQDLMLSYAATPVPRSCTSRHNCIISFYFRLFNFLKLWRIAVYFISTFFAEHFNFKFDLTFALVRAFDRITTKRFLTGLLAGILTALFSRTLKLAEPRNEPV